MNAARTKWLKETRARLVNLAEESLVVALSNALPKQLKEAKISKIVEEMHYIEKTIDVVLGIADYPIKLDVNKAANYHLN